MSRGSHEERLLDRARPEGLLVNLCDHVDLEQNKSTVTVVRGVAVPLYGWDREAQADVPLLRCSTCDARVFLPGPAVARGTRTEAPNRRQEDGWDLL